MKFEHLTNPTTDEVLSQFVSHVTKTNQDLAEEARNGKQSTTELKVFIAENKGFSSASLETVVSDVLQDEDTNKNPRKFFESHHFDVSQLNDEAYHLTIKTPEYERSDDFLLLESGDYLKAITVIRRKWTKKTIEKLIKYLDSLERLFITSDDLEDIVEPNENRNLTGFTAKYKPFYKNERVSVQVHGGTDEHLRDVESTFSARPKRIEFGQTENQSGVQASIRQDGGGTDGSTAVVNAAIRQDGYASIPQVRDGYEKAGVSTINSVISAYEQTDAEKFEVNHRPERIKPGERHFISQLHFEEFDDTEDTAQFDGGLPEKLKSLDQGSVMEGVTIWDFQEEMPGEEYPNEDGVAKNLELKIFELKDRYSYSEINPRNFLVYDRRCGESFEVIVSGKQIRVYAKPNTTSSSFREFYNILDEDFNSTYSFTKDSHGLRA